MYGELARFGLIVPSPNAVIEPDFSRALGPFLPRISVHAARLPIEGYSGVDAGAAMNSLTNMAGETERAASELRPIATAIAYACTSGSFVHGRLWAADLVKRIEEVTGLPAVATAECLVQAGRHLGVEKICLATPYSEELTERQVAFLTDAGFDVLTYRCLDVQLRKKGFPWVHPPEAAYDLAMDALAPGCEAIMISCTNFRAFDVIAKLEAETGLPVITSNQATLWALIRAAGLDLRVDGFGRLLSEVPAARSSAS
jgi:maleate isomerase